jgi:hypothetical protein
VVALHRSTLVASAALDVCDPRPVPPSDELSEWGRRRYSAKDFTGQSVPRDVYAQITDLVLAAPSMCFGEGSRLVPYAIRLRVDGLPHGCERLSGDAPVASPAADAQRLARDFRFASQAQGIVERCAFAIVICASYADLAALGPTGYRHAVLNAGAICADLYRAATDLPLATTTIGGFSDHAIQQLLSAPGLHPIVIQAFGIPAANVLKLDAAHGTRAAERVGPAARKPP